MKKGLTPRLFISALIAFVILSTLLVYFGSQTWQLVDWLFPAQKMWMKVGALFSFDIMAFVWGFLGIVYEFRVKGIKYMAETMSIISFILATIASVLQMIMAATERMAFLLSPDFIAFAYGIVIFAITLQLVTLGIGVRVEINAHMTNVPTRPMGNPGLPNGPHPQLPAGNRPMPQNGQSPLTTPHAQSGN